MINRLRAFLGLNKAKKATLGGGPRIQKKSFRPSTILKTQGDPTPANARAILAVLHAAAIGMWFKLSLVTRPIRPYKLPFASEAMVAVIQITGRCFSVHTDERAIPWPPYCSLSDPLRGPDECSPRSQTTSSADHNHSCCLVVTPLCPEKQPS